MRPRQEVDVWRMALSDNILSPHGLANKNPALRYNIILPDGDAKMPLVPDLHSRVFAHYLCFYLLIVVTCDEVRSLTKMFFRLWRVDNILVRPKPTETGTCRPRNLMAADIKNKEKRRKKEKE